MLRFFLQGDINWIQKIILFLKELYAIPFGGKSIYTAEIWYVNKTSVMDIKWGTAQPVELQDPNYKLIIPLTSHGSLE